MGEGYMAFEREIVFQLFWRTQQFEVRMNANVVQLNRGLTLRLF